MKFPQEAIIETLETSRAAWIYANKFGVETPPYTKVEQMALEKQIQIDPAPGNYCPKCDHKIFLQSQNYCGNCGQAIRRREIIEK